MTDINEDHVYTLQTCLFLEYKFICCR